MEKIMNNQLQVILNEQGIEKADASRLIEAFGGPFEEAGVILASYKSIVVKDENDTDSMFQAREQRLILKKARTTVENNRKDLKSDIVKQGRAIDNIARFVKEQIEPAEEYLELQEKFAEITKAERLSKIKSDRVEKLMQYTDDISMYNIDNIEDETFEFLLAKVKKEYDDKIAAEKAEAERLVKEEAERKAEQERIIAENAKLRKEAEEKEIALAVERKKEAEKQAKIEAERQKELEVERSKVEAERAKLQVIEEAKRVEEEKIRKAQAEAEEAERKALLSPDKDKLITFSKAIEIIRKEKLPAVKTKQAQDIINAVELKLSQLFNFINDEAGKL